MNLATIAKETIKITAEKRYQIGENVCSLPEMDFQEVIVCSPEDGQKLLNEDDAVFHPSEFCKIIIENCDSYQSARKLKNPMVMNFANAHFAGGGFLGGAVAQEEALCRCSTLYASITSKTASEMYTFNNTHISNVESDYNLYYPLENQYVVDKYNYDLYLEVYKILKFHTEIRHIRGGESTRKKYLKGC